MCSVPENQSPIHDGVLSVDGEPLWLGAQVSPADDVWWGTVTRRDVAERRVYVEWVDGDPKPLRDGWYPAADLFLSPKAVI